ncbi:MAG: hypothetical protein AAGF11_50610 [Myxococcota bacterium]
MRSHGLSRREPRRPWSGLELGLALGPVLGGCYSTELDPDLTGVFACRTAQESAEQPACPSGQTCVNGRCEDSNALPTLSIINPEESKVFLVDLSVGNAMEVDPIPVNLTVQGSNLELVGSPSSSDHVFGQGQVAIYMDGEEVATVTEGSLSAPAPLPLLIPPIPGPHRIAVRARRNDGLDYDNDSALSTRLVWVENANNEGVLPMVAIRWPWPGTIISTDDEQVEVRITTLNFQLVDADNTDNTRREAEIGHAHVYYDQEFPRCAMDDLCDDSYLGVAGTPPAGELSRSDLVLPASDEQIASLTAVLRHYNHSIYRHPFGCEDPGSEAESCQLIFEEIEIIRVVD